MSDPLSGGFGGFDPRMFEHVPLFRELRKVMEWRGGPVNWDFANQTAMSLAQSDLEEPRGDRDEEELAAAVRTGELWLDQVTALPSVEGPVRALTRAEWTREATTTHGLGVYVEPIAEGMATALTQQLPGELNLGAMGQAGQPNPFMAVGAMLYGMQCGMIAGNLASQLLSAYDLGVPTMDPRLVGTVGDAAQRFADDYGFDPVELRHWLAISEAAHRRQFAGVPWLHDHLRDLVRRFAAEADLDPGSMLEQLGLASLDPADPSALQQALEAPDAFHLEPTAAQQAVLDELQAMITFTLAWVDTVVRAAAHDKLASLSRIEEAVQRRRAEKGPGERFLTQLLGLDLTPGDVRQAQAFCDAVITARGQEGLDRAWRAPTHLPRPDELIEPSRWLVRLAAVELETGEGPPDDG